MDKSSKPSGMAMLTSSIPSQRWGKAIAIHELAPNFGFVAAPLISEAVMVWFSWRAVILLFGCATLIMSPVFYYYSGGLITTGAIFTGSLKFHYQVN